MYKKQYFTSIARRPEHWGWLLTSGIISVIFAIMILMKLVASTFLLLGTMVGVYMIFAGIEMIMLYSASKK